MTLSELKNNSYAPYSGRSVRAVVKSSAGHYYPGIRIENISFPLTISAAQNALFCCLSEEATPEVLYTENNGTEATCVYWKEQLNVQIHPLDELAEIDFKPVLRSVEDMDVTEKLQHLLPRALVMHSNFPVSALLQTGSGFISGVNIETSDWSRGLCAERVALAKAITYGFTDFVALHICTRDGEYSSPCGACRQVIVEHLPHHPVHLHHADGSTSQHFSSDLLPYSFQSSSLKTKRS